MSLSPSDPSHRSSTLPVTTLFIVLGLLAWFFYTVRGVLAPFLMGMIMAYLLNPAVAYLEVHGVRREKAVVLLTLLLGTVVTVLVYFGLKALWQEIPNLRDDWPGYMRQAEASLRQIQVLLETSWPHLRESKYFGNFFTGGIDRLQNIALHSPALMASFFHLLVNLLLAPFLAFFFLQAGPRIAQLGLDACPGLWVERFLNLLNKGGQVVGNYTRGILAEALLVGVFSTLGLHWVGLNYALLVGLSAGVGNVVPYGGPVVGAVLGVIAAFLQFSNLTGPVQVLLVFVVVHYVDSYIFQPLIMKRSVDLDPVTVVFALLCGAHLGGLWGLILAVPTAGVIKEVGAVFYVWYRAERGLIVPSKEIALLAQKPWVV